MGQLWVKRGAGTRDAKDGSTTKPAGIMEVAMLGSDLD